MLEVMSLCLANPNIYVPVAIGYSFKLHAGGSTLADLIQALEDYLPVLLGLVKDGEAPVIHSCWLLGCIFCSR